MADIREQIPERPPFDPESADYDMESAVKYGLKPGSDGHWPSRVPQTGLLLKGKKHNTWDLLEQGEAQAGMEIYKGDDGRYYSKPQEPMTYITNMPEAISEFKDDSQLRMPDITSPNNDRFMFIPDKPGTGEQVAREWGADVDILEMPKQPTDEELMHFERRKKFRDSLVSTMGLDPDDIARKAENDYLRAHEVKTPQVYIAAKEYAAKARAEAEKKLDPYLSMFDERIKKEAGMKDYKQKADYQHRLIQQRQEGRQGVKNFETILKNLESEAYKQAVRETQFKYKDSLSFEVDATGMPKMQTSNNDALNFFNQRLDELKNDKITAAVKRGALPANYAPEPRSNIPKAIEYLKGAQDREQAKAMIRELANQGWTKGQLSEIAQGAGWE